MGHPVGGGKTYTMVGTPDTPGVMVLALNHLFTEMDNDSESVHKVSLQFSMNIDKTACVFVRFR